MGAITTRKKKYGQASKKVKFKRRILTETVWDSGATLWDFDTTETADTGRRTIWDKTEK